jgi:hypothetical protein
MGVAERIESRNDADLRAEAMDRSGPTNRACGRMAKWRCTWVVHGGSEYRKWTRHVATALPETPCVCG